MAALENHHSTLPLGAAAAAAADDDGQLAFSHRSGGVTVTRFDVIPGQKCGMSDGGCGEEEKQTLELLFHACAYLLTQTWA